MDNRIDVRLDAAPRPAEEPQARPRTEASFRILLLGDFTGRAARGMQRADLSDLRPLSVDRDDLDQVLARLRPRLTVQLPAWDAPVEIGFSCVDDFHPDHLFERAPLFRELRDLRRRAADSARWKDVAKEMDSTAAAARPTPPEAPSPPARGGGVLDLILEESEPAAPEHQARPPATADELRTYVRRIVAPHLVASPDPRQSELIELIDQTIDDQLRAVLHDPAFQSLEALWRAAWLLVRRVETTTDLRIELLDVTREEVRADLLATDGRESRLSRLIQESEDAPWSLLVGAWSIRATEEDVKLVRAMAELGREAGAPFLAEADPVLAGAPELRYDRAVEPADWSETSPEWRQLRKDSLSRWAGLAIPGFLLRLPYGEDSDPCDDLDFEEFLGLPEHDDYLWGNPAIACAILLAQSFSRDGRDMRPDTVRTLERLPLHLIRRDGGVTATPCAEITMTDRIAGRLLAEGFIPLAAGRDRDAVQVVRFQSIADPPAPLAGPWSTLT